MDERLVDLHCHSSASSGAMGTPYRVAAAFRELGYAAFALTEHDNFDSLEDGRLAAAKEGLEFIPGIELSARAHDPRLAANPRFPDEVFHILGYLYEPTPELRELARTIHDRSGLWVRGSLERLRERGVADISEDDLKRWIPERFGADDRWKKPYGDLGPAGDLLRQRGALGPEGGNDAVRALFESVYPQSELPPLPTARDVCDLLARAGAVRVLAHPGNPRSTPSPDEERRLTIWLEEYVDGIEVYTPKHPPAYRRMLLDLVARLGRPFSGGSDRHDYARPASQPSDAPYACVKSLRNW